jgi:transposase-like protein
MNNYIRVSEVAKQMDVNHNTLRRWLIQYEDYLITKRDKNMKYVHKESINTLLLIKEYYAEFKKEHEILDLLASNPEVIKNVEGEDVEEEQLNEYDEQADKALTPVPVNVADELRRMNVKLDDRFDQQNEFNKLLVEELKKQREEIKALGEKLEQSKVENLRIMMGERKATAEASVSQEKKKGFFSRLFGK